MNEYTYDEILTGQEEAFRVTLSEEMMEKFLQITGDVNPLHRNAEYARTRQYVDKVGDEMLGSCFFAGLGGV